MKEYFVKSTKTGGHFAFKTEKSSKPFENPLHYYARFPLEKDDIVADIGAYVGEYALFALRKGVKQVKCYEPTPQSFNILKKNKRPGMELHNLAVVGNDNPTVKLYISTGIGVTNSIAKSKADFLEVPAIRYEDAVKGCTVVKIDVEGAEYEYNLIAHGLRGIILEFHPLVGVDWKANASKIMQDLESKGYKCLLKPGFKSGWDLTGCWVKP